MAIREPRSLGIIENWGRGAFFDDLSTRISDTDGK